MLTILPSSICLVRPLAISTGWICRLKARPKTPSTSDSIRFSMFLRMPKETYPLTLAMTYRNTAYIIAARPSEITASVSACERSETTTAYPRTPPPTATTSPTSHRPVISPSETASAIAAHSTNRNGKAGWDAEGGRCPPPHPQGGGRHDGRGPKGGAPPPPVGGAAPRGAAPADGRH